MENFEQQLKLKQKELDLILAIDRVCDSALTPTAMLSSIANVLLDLFVADLCLLYLINQETGELELKILNEHNRGWSQLHESLVHDAVRQALLTDRVVVWNASESVPPEKLGQISPDLQVVLVPVIMESRDLPLGLLLLARMNAPFLANDLELLSVAESQIDSAIVQGYTQHELAQRNKELETIYRFDHIRDQQMPFDEMLDVVLHELCEVISAEMGFVMLYNQQGEQLEMRAITHKDLMHDMRYYTLINRLANEAMTTGELVSYREGNAHCMVMCIPLILRNEIIGVFGAVNRGARHAFTSDDRRLLYAVVSQMDTAILESMERRKLRGVLGRSLDPHILEKLLANTSDNILEGERTVVTVLYADLRGSTDLAERTAPETFVDFVNAYLGEMTEVVLSHGGTLDKFVGDEVMALFNAPLPQADHALRSVQVGLAMQVRQQELLARWRAEHGIEAGGIGVGIATGEAIVGEIGCEKRTDYTVMGRPANLGARICAVAKTGEVLVSEETYQLIRDRVEATPVPDMQFKGIHHPVTVYRIHRVLETGDTSGE
ncbi:MAG: GAF domain-containing protein [Anaerolineae bacterium]|nr:GAF domain-containing protein [Anaerolineae bacterium]